MLVYLSLPSLSRWASASSSASPCVFLRGIDLTRDLRESGAANRPVSAAPGPAPSSLPKSRSLLFCSPAPRPAHAHLHQHPSYRPRLPRRQCIYLPRLRSGLCTAGTSYSKTSAHPGVRSASAISHLPLDDAGNWYDYYYREGALTRRANPLLIADHRSTLPGYFTAVGATLLEGRDFSDDDDAQHQHVIIDDVLARQLWPGQSAIGQKINLCDSPQASTSSSNATRRSSLASSTTCSTTRSLPSSACTRCPYALAPRPSMSFVLDTSGPGSSLAAAVRNTIDAVNKNIPITHVEPMQLLLDRAHAGELRSASLLATLLCNTLRSSRLPAASTVSSSFTPSHSARQKSASEWPSALHALRSCA